MPLRAIYSNSTGSNVDISSRIRAYQMSVTQYAEQGSVAMSQLEVDDPEGGINILGLRRIILTEESESSNQQTIGRFFTADRDIVRHESLRTGAARLWRVNMTDPNSIITRRIMRGADANRPAETDVERVQWLLTTTELGTNISTSRYVSTLFPVAMDAVDYRDQSNQQILDDCSQASGKNYFAFYDEPVGAYGLFYDFPGSSVFRSAIQLTNILGLVDNDISFGVISESTKLNRDPSRVYSGVVLPYVGGEVYVQNDTTATEFFHRDTTAPSVNVKTHAKALARANRYLTDIRTEADVISTAFIVPLSKVNHLQVGQAVQCWFSHFPGYDTGWNWMRVLNRTVTATSEEYYTIEVELAAGIGGLDNGPGSVPFPPEPIVAPIPPQSCIGGDGLHYDYTLAGTRTALGLSPLDDSSAIYTSTSTNFIQYGSTPTDAANPNVPTAGLTGHWAAGGGSTLGHFFDHQAGSVGPTDYNTGGTEDWVKITVVGPGTLSLVVSATGGPNENGVLGPPASNIFATAYAVDSATAVATSGNLVGGTGTVVIPAGYCAYYVMITGDHQWGFTSATWTPA